MCQIKSGIVLKDRVFCPLDYDSHEEMIKELKLDDSTNKPNFVRVEICPKDVNIFNHDIGNWILKVDQDYRPDWFSEKFATEEMKKELQRWFDERFVLGKKESINSGRWFLGGSAQVKNICDSSQVEYIGDSAQVEYIGDSAQVKNIGDSAQVKNIGDSAQVEYIGDSAQVKNIGDSAQVKNICGSAQVKNICGSAQVKNIGGSAQVEYIGDSSQVKNIGDSSQVKNIGDSAQVENICGSAQVENIGGSAQVEYIGGSAQVEYIGGRSVCCFTGKNAKYKTIKENGIAILYYKENPEIIVANNDIKLKKFKEKK